MGVSISALSLLALLAALPLLAVGLSNRKRPWGTVVAVLGLALLLGSCFGPWP